MNKTVAQYRQSRWQIYATLPQSQDQYSDATTIILNQSLLALYMLEELDKLTTDKE